ncbi:MAG: hypothetical protein LBB57_05925, partial [Clostridiales Family XIII bacterium]|nr:hypothetical protein [Clostridiales Family XIII bacterium]
YNISFRRPLSERALLDISKLIDDTDAIEGKADQPFLLSSGTREITLSVIGVERDTVFYNFKD